MGFFNPFHQRIKRNDTTPKPKYISADEVRTELKAMKTMKNDITSGVMKSMPKGRSFTDNSTNSSGLSISSNIATLADATDELQRKRYLRDISQNVIIQSILRTRDSQVQKYCQPARYSSDNVGFKVVPKDPDSDGKLSPQQRNTMKRLENFIYYTGATDAQMENRDTFPVFITKFIRNHFVYDQINVERVFTKHNKSDHLDHFNIDDAGTIVLGKIPVHEDDRRKFLQYTSLNRSEPVKFDDKHMTFVTTHGGEIDRHGYGYSETAACMMECQFERTTEDFNARFFSQGGTTRGILLIDSQGDTQASAAAIKALRQQWQSGFQGIQGAWKIPVISAHDAKFVSMTQTSKDMEFERWLNYLINIICAIFQIQPDEINFPNRGGGATSKAASSSINEGSTQKSKMEQSKDKGLLPLMTLIQNFMNDYIMPYIDKGYRFVFTLGDDKTEQEHEAIISAKEKNGMTINEARKAEGYSPLKNKIFDTIPGDTSTVGNLLNSINAQNAQSDKQNQAQSDMDNNDNPNHQNSIQNVKPGDQNNPNGNQPNNVNGAKTNNDINDTQNNNQSNNG